MAPTVSETNKVYQHQWEELCDFSLELLIYSKVRTHNDKLGDDAEGN